MVTREEIYVCVNCAGNGNCPDCSGNGIDINGDDVCMACVGSGECTECDGNGEVNYDDE